AGAYKHKVPRLGNHSHSRMISSLGMTRCGVLFGTAEPCRDTRSLDTRSADAQFPDGRAIGLPAGTGTPKLGEPSRFQVKGWARGERCAPQPWLGSELAW